MDKKLERELHAFVIYLKCYLHKYEFDLMHFYRFIRSFGHKKIHIWNKVC